MPTTEQYVENKQKEDQLKINQLNDFLGKFGSSVEQLMSKTPREYVITNKICVKTNLHESIDDIATSLLYDGLKGADVFFAITNTEVTVEPI